MKGKIGLEKHFATEDTLADSKGFLPEDTWTELRGRLLDFHDRRLAEMDRHGVEMMVLSLNAPAVQAIPDPKRADETARRANDFLAEQVGRRPDRFQALAALPMQDPDLAIRELTRCVRDLGFRGALVNGFSQVDDADSMVFYDPPQYWPFWEAVERLDMPFYLHPRNPLPSQARLRTDSLLHRLAVRECRPCGGLVRRRPDQRGRPDEDRADQRDEAVQAGYGPSGPLPSPQAGRHAPRKRGIQ